VAGGSPVMLVGGGIYSSTAVNPQSGAKYLIQVGLPKQARYTLSLGIRFNFIYIIDAKCEDY
jgi:hypothetical protein